MNTIDDNKTAQISSIVSKEKKAKINWLLAVTQISFEELQSIVEKLGFIIKGEYVALPTETKRISDDSIWIPTTIIKEFSSSDTSIQNKEKYCPICAIPLKGTEEFDQLIGTCPNCGQAFEEIFHKKLESEYFKKKCLHCSQINPVKVKFCFNCSSERLERIIPKTETSIKKMKNTQKFLKAHQVDAIVIFIVSLLWIVAASITAGFKGFDELVSTSIIIVLYVLGVLFFFWPLYYLDKYTTLRKYKRYFED